MAPRVLSRRDIAGERGCYVVAHRVVIHVLGTGQAHVVDVDIAAGCGAHGDGSGVLFEQESGDDGKKQGDRSEAQNSHGKAAGEDNVQVSPAHGHEHEGAGATKKAKRLRETLQELRACWASFCRRAVRA